MEFLSISTSVLYTVTIQAKVDKTEWNTMVHRTERKTNEDRTSIEIYQ